VVDPVKRRYDNSARQARTRSTRSQVVDAARRVFVERGYAATTVDAISGAADVPVATVYRLFGSKRGILQAVLDVAFVGDDEPLALHDRPTARGAAAEPDPRRMLAGYAKVAREVLERSGPLQQVLRSAAEVDPDAAALLAQVNEQRLAGQARVARGLVERSALAAGLTEAAATDTIYALMSPELHQVLTVERAWSQDRYERWLADALAALLVRPPGT
jgi:AcrR family transcriptional regulator